MEYFRQDGLCLFALDYHKAVRHGFLSDDRYREYSEAQGIRCLADMLLKSIVRRTDRSGQVGHSAQVRDQFVQ